MVNSEPNLCPTLRPTRQQFEKPFSEYVREQFLKHPEWACFKVIPPKRWTPNKRHKYDLANVRIATPIRQHAFGKSGAYRCILEEQRSMTAADFEKMATSAAHQAPERGHRDDDFLERSFWSSVTINPPLYGADTPVSFFDERLDYGWNLRRLGCLLSKFDVPEIPGVTTPMAYFGSWKSFFGWHKEDIDLYSINYNHAGAAKIWYCVSPKDGAKFDSMARGLFPELHAACPAFVRHKDILISPRLLRAAGVPFVQARQEPGEFIVLNAAAYHSGFNLGFNIAEAVNFALPEWLEIGRQAVNCECDAMPDGVCLDMGIFFPDLRVSEDESSDEEAEEGSGDDDETSDDEESGSESSCTVRSTDRVLQRKKGRQMGSSKTGVRGRTSRNHTREAPSSPAQTARKRRRLNSTVSSSSTADEQESDSSTVTEVTVSQRHRKRTPVSSTTKRAQARQRPVAVPAAQRGGGVRTGRSRVPAGALHVAWGAVAEERPVALVERASEGARAPFYTLVHRLAKSAGKPGAIWVGLLKEGTDGLFRPTGIARQVVLGPQHPRLVRVRCEWLQRPTERRRGGWRLITLPKRILM